MRRFINPLLLWAAHAEHSDLIRQIQYLKVENEVLRGRLPRKINTTPKERQRLLEYARPLGNAINHLVSIVKPVTIRTWLRADRGVKGVRRCQRHRGRPRTSRELEQLVIRIARENGWGYTRILGELRKLGMRAICRSTVVNILKRAGLDPCPHRKRARWDTFIKRHADTLWACDLLQRKVLTILGWRYVWILLFINVKTRRAWASPSTRNPDCLWTAWQAGVFMRQTGDSGPRMVLHDNDARLGEPFREALKHYGAEPEATPYRSPNLNTYAERFVQTILQECLDHFIVFGCRHMDYLVREFLEHYHTERPHQAVGNLPLMPLAGTSARGSPQTVGRVIRRERLGGLLKDYRWREAA